MSWESMSRKDASELVAQVVARDGGGFTAVASNGRVDRDGEIIQLGAFNPLPASIPVCLDHTMRAADVMGRGRPYYRGAELLIDVVFASTPDAQLVRQKVADGVLDSVSIVFRGTRWETIDGVRTCTAGELLGCDLVSIPSNVDARVLSVRGYATQRTAGAVVAEFLANELEEAAEAQLKRARRYLELAPAAEPRPAPEGMGLLALHHYGGNS